jgi:hypothetical protein
MLNNINTPHHIFKYISELLSDIDLPININFIFCDNRTVASQYQEYMRNVSDGIICYVGALPSTYNSWWHNFEKPFDNDLLSYKNITILEPILFVESPIQNHKVIKTPSGIPITVTSDNNEVFFLSKSVFNFCYSYSEEKKVLNDHILKYIILESISSICDDFQYTYEPLEWFQDGESIKKAVAGISEAYKGKYDAEIIKEKSLLESLKQVLEKKKLYSIYIGSFKNVDKIKNQLETINSLDFISWVELSGQYMQFLMKNITIYSDEFDEEYYIGDIICIVSLVNGKVTFDNITQKIDAYTDGSSHPHDTGNGSMCLGNVGPMVMTLIQEQQYVALVNLLYNFAQSVNEDDSAGQYIERWPILD